MNPVQAKKRIEWLIEELWKHNYAYHVLDQPTISDAAFDTLMMELRQLEEAYPEFKSPYSPTSRIGGAPLKRFNKVQHSVAMLSLQNIYTHEEFIDFYDRIQKLLPSKAELEFVLEPKLDGLAVELIYKDQKLSYALTRGDGVWGEDVTENVRTIRSVPLTLQKNAPSYLEVRGEVIMKLASFYELNQERIKLKEPLFANPRNAASGSIRQLDPKIAAQRKLFFFSYWLVQTQDNKGQFSLHTHIESLHRLKELGFFVNPLIHKTTDPDEVNKYIQKISKQREKLSYEIDGVVIKVNNLEYQEILGSTSNSPRWAVAYKFASIAEMTTLKDVVFGVSRRGVVTPVAILEPVTICGVVVQKASLHNYNFMQNLGIRKGDKVLVRRAGDVIPELESVLFHERTGKEQEIVFPTHCPSCQTPLVHEGAFFVCTNNDCKEKLKESLRHFVSKGGMNIEGLGPAWITLLVDEGFVKKYSDIYELNQKDLLKLDRQGEVSSQKLLASIEKSKIIPLNKFIYALGIQYIGERTALLLAQHFHTLAQILDASEEELSKVPEIGPKVIEALRKFKKEKWGKDILPLLKKIEITDVTKKPLDKNHLFSGKTIVVTGSFSQMTREEIIDLIRKKGGNVTNSVSNKTNFLIVGKDPGSKLQKALALGVEILSDEEKIKGLLYEGGTK